jgi:hypothetical protein
MPIGSVRNVRLRLPRLAALPHLEPRLRAAPVDYGELVEAIKPTLPRLDESEFLDWLKEKKKVVFLFGPPGTGKTYHATRLAARGRVDLPHGVTVVLHDGDLPAAAGYFTVSMAQDAERRWARDLGGLCNGQVTTIHSFAVRSLGLGLRIFPTAWRGPDGRLHLSHVEGAEAVHDISLAIELARAAASKSVGLAYSLDPYVQEPGNYLFQLFDYALHVGGVPALRAAYMRLDARGQAVWRRYLKLLRWPPELINQVLHGKSDSLCEAAGGGYELYKALVGGRIKLDFTLTVEVARCLRQPYLLTCGKQRIAPRVLLLDEFQDLSPALRNLVVRVFPDAEYVVLAGDDDQLIYDSLHGASADITLKIVEMIQKGEIPGEYHVLAKSFRVPETPIAEVARRIIEAVPNRVKKVWQGRPEPGRILRIHRSQLRQAVESELAAGRKVFVLAADNATAQSLMLELMDLLPAGLKGLPGSLRRLYSGVLDHLKKRNLLINYIREEASHERPNADIIRFLEMIKGREEEAVKIIKMALDTERALERLEKLRLFVDTVHAAKGLEADVVFIANFTTSEKLVGNRRLTYVALTRAREAVYIVENEDGKRWLAEV